MDAPPAPELDQEGGAPGAPPFWHRFTPDRVAAHPLWTRLTAAQLWRKLAPAHLAALGLVGVTIIAGVLALPDRRPRPANQILAVVGDSITDSSREELTAMARDAGWRPTIEAVPGAMTTEMQARARRLADRQPRVAVIHLGTNDSMCSLQNALGTEPCRHNPYTPADMDQALRDMAVTLRDPGSCVIGVMPYLDNSGQETLERLHAEGTVDGVANWHDVAGGHDEHIADALGHLTPTGQVAYARFVVDEAARICGPPPPGPAS